MKDDIRTTKNDADDDAGRKVQTWRGKREPSRNLVRLELCCDLTVVQGASLSGWAAFAWLTGLEAPTFHNVAMYGGVFCIQYLLLTGVWFVHRFLDDWNDLNMRPIIVQATKNLLDVAVNLLLRLVVWGAVVTSLVFGGFNLRIALLHSVTNVVISFSALANFVVLLHLSGTIIEDATHYVSALTEDKPDPVTGEVRKSRSRGIVMRLALGYWLLLIKMALWGCRGVHYSLHLWPLADSVLLSSLTALIAYLSRSSLDSAWLEPDQLQHARLVARDSRLLIWPTVVLALCFVYDVARSILKLSHEYALRLLISMSTIGTEDNNNAVTSSEEVPPTNAVDEVKGLTTTTTIKPIVIEDVTEPKVAE